jgi:hypothetical protein
MANMMSRESQKLRGGIQSLFRHSRSLSRESSLFFVIPEVFIGNPGSNQQNVIPG